MIDELLSRVDNPIELYKGIITTSFDKGYLHKLNINNSDENYPLLASKLNKTGRETLGLQFTDVAELAGLDVNTYVMMEMTPEKFSMEEHWVVFEAIMRHKEREHGM